MNAAPPQAGAPISLPGRLALIMGSCFNAIGIFTIGIPLPAMRAAFVGAPYADMLIPAIAGIGGPAFALASPAFGRLVDRLGYRAVYGIGILLYELGGLAPVLLDDLWLILLSRIVLALGVSACLAASLAGIASLPQERRPGLFGLLNLMSACLVTIAYPAVGLLVKMGWHDSFLIHLMLLPVLGLVRALPGKAVVADPGTTGTPPLDLAGGLQPALLLAIVVFGLSMSAGSFYGPTYMAGVGITDPARSGLSLSIMSIASTAASAVYGRVHARIGTRASLAIFVTLFGLGGLLIGLSASWAAITAGFCLSGIGTVGFVAALYTSITGAMGERSGSALGAANLALYGSQILFPLLVSQVAVRFGGSALFLTLSLAALVVTLPITMLHGHRAA